MNCTGTYGGWATTEGGVKTSHKPVSGNTYHVGLTAEGKVNLLRTPAGMSSYTFPGSVVLQGGQLAHKGMSNGTVTIPTLICKSPFTSQINLASGFSTAGLQNAFLGTRWTVEEGAVLTTAENSSGDHRDLRFSTQIVGAGTIQVAQVNANVTEALAAVITYDGDLYGFTGRFLAFNMAAETGGTGGLTVRFTRRTAFTGGPAVPDADSVVIKDGTQLSFAESVVTHPNRGFKFEGAIINVDAGKTVVIRGSVAAPTGFTKTGGGLLILAGEASAVNRSAVTVTGGEVQYGLPPAKCFYVAPDGDDAAEGTLEAPLKTLTCAYNKAAIFGDTIYLKDGTYPLEAVYSGYSTETVTYSYGLCLLIRKDVQIEGLSKDPTKVILDAQSKAKLMVLDSPFASIRYLTLQNGYLLEPADNGAGSDMGGNLRLIRGQASNCVFKDGMANGLGGNVAVQEGGWISASVIRGGGLSASQGAALALFSLGGLVENCLITGVRGSDPRNKNVGTCCVSGRQGARFVNCTFAGNEPNPNSYFAEIHEKDPETGNQTRYINCAFFDNGGRDFTRYANQLRYCAAAEAISDWGAGCVVVANPLFTNAAQGDYSLGKKSPLIGVGNVELYRQHAAADKDLAGKNRINNETISIGCYEFVKKVMMFMVH